MLAATILILMWKIKFFFIIFFALTIASCKNDKPKRDSPTLKSEIAVEGKFVRLDKINDRDYNIFLKLDNDSIVALKTMMPLDQYEISLLKREGNNIRLKYSEYYNKETNQIDKFVKLMTPIYEQK